MPLAHFVILSVQHRTRHAPKKMKTMYHKWKTHKLYEIIPQKTENERDEIRLIVIVDRIQKEQLVIGYAKVRAK
uniref:30S ribosomal protein S17 n=1 Tax=Angiostrongylus cantonensis TaxID=6313 RepID=A0A0K0CWM1_ANGCA